MASRALDCEIDRLVFGHPIAQLTPESLPVRTDAGMGDASVPHYSTDIAAAFEVVAHMLDRQADDFQLRFRSADAVVINGDGDEAFWSDHWEASFDAPYFVDHEEADSAPLAICRAALQAIKYA